MSDSYYIKKLIVALIGFIIFLVVAYFKGKIEDKKDKGTHIVHETDESKGSKENINNNRPKSISTNLNKLPSLYFRGIKYSLLSFLSVAIISGPILMAIHFYLGLGIFILIVVMSIFAHKNYIKNLIYKGLTIEEQKIIINKYPPKTDQIILFDGIHKITFEDIYQKDNKGYDQKVGCEMIFWNNEDRIIDSFDVEKFKKSEQLKTAIFKKLGIS